ncbi:hypothetical protein ACHWQZ_G005851 [Mnemiopsis leidyi]
MQQYAVDQFAKIEGSRLDWVRNNQRAIRAEKYSGLIDANGQNDLQNAGRRIILPPTVYGSPRFYHEKFQDAMAIVRKFGKPDLFLTFTCNPQWQEIQEALNEGESYTDRPDLCVRVFKMKMDELLSDLTCLHVMGKVKAYTPLEEDSHLYPLEYIHTLIPSGVPPHELKLKKGCPIMLMRNFDPYKGHCNGTKYIVVNLHSRIIEAKIASGPYKDNVLFIPRIVIKPSESTFPFQLKRKQFPVRPCFAITANKSQGQTLGKVGICLERPFFSHGAYYVAQSRVGKKSSLKIMADTQFTENVVYPEIL